VLSDAVKYPIDPFFIVALTYHNKLAAPLS
jgi:hypothetical protein